MDRIKVIRLIPELNYGGVESCFVIQSMLTDRDRFDFRVCTLWKAGASAQAIRETGVEVDVLDASPSVRSLETTAKLYQYFRHHKPDVIHASIGEGIFHASIAGALAGVPVRIMEEVGMPSRSPVARLIFSALSRFAHKVIGVSQSTCDYLIQQEHMSPQTVTLVYNCGHPDYFEPVDRDYDRTGRRFRLFTAGRLEYVKNQSMLIDAMASLVQHHDDIELWIAGAGTKHDELQAKISALGLNDHVKLLGFRDDVRDLLLESDVFVIPSFSEGTSVAMVESMATGIPILGSTAAGVSALMTTLDDRYTIAPHDTQGWVDAILHLYNMTPRARAAVGQAAKEVAFETFSPQSYMARIESMYASLYEEATR